MPKLQAPIDSVELPEVSDAALSVLRALKGASMRYPMSAKAVARAIWPERMREAGTSLRRGGLYRSAGGFCSKLLRRGLVKHWITDFDSGYYLTGLGERVLAAHEPAAGHKPE
jgi:hypothetical protein